MTTLTEPVTREDLAECLGNLVASLHRMPTHWVERRAELHRQINDRLDEYEAARW